MKLRNHPIIYGIRKFFKFIHPLCKLFIVINKLYALLLLQKTQYYQPLYHFSIIKKKQPERICIDRADAIYREIHTHYPRARILDIGCNFGYFSYYFADRGFEVTGIDYSLKNIRICHLLNQIHGKNICFSTANFSEPFVDALKPNEYQFAFLFSVMHHLIYSNSLSYAQDLIAHLLEKIPVLFIELALKTEPTSSPWKSALPEDERLLFAKCKDITIKKIGSFATSKGMIGQRPLYKVSRC